MWFPSGIFLCLLSLSFPILALHNENDQSPLDLDPFPRPRSTTKAPPYTPDWASLDARPLPPWYDSAKFGIFIHWGVFSVPSFLNEWFWYYWEQKEGKVLSFLRENYPARWTYPDFGREFTAEFFSPSEWAELFKKSGAKYVVLTTKHHEGFTLWPSKHSFAWNAGDLGPKRDLVGELEKAVRNAKLRFGVYHSWFEFFNPLYLEDKANNYTSWKYVKSKALPEWTDLVMKYKPDLLWSDGEWEAGPEYWRSREFLAWLYNQSPVKDVVVVNDRWGKGTPCKHGGYMTCKDEYNPGKLLPYKWENAKKVEINSWGYRRDAVLEDFYSTQALIQELVTTVSCGGNFLLNIGPRKDGMIPPIMQERLLEIGAWLGINGNAIFDSKPFTAQNDSVSEGVWYTQKPGERKIFVCPLLAKE